MDTSIVGDRIIVLWQVLLAGGAGIFSVTFVPWLIGFKWRKKDEQTPALASRVTACAALAIAGLLVWPVFLFFYLGIFAGVEFFCVFLPGMVIIIGCGVWAERIRKEWGMTTSSYFLLIKFVCGVSGGICTLGTVWNSSDLANPDISSLHAISFCLTDYHQRYGVYPDDLRRLVDEGLVSGKVLLGSGSSVANGVGESPPVPYRGPCEFVYIRLPEDAPGDLVWVWLPAEHGDSVSVVLWKNGKAHWLKTEQLTAAVARTHKWLKAHPATQPTTAPVGA